MKTMNKKYDELNEREKDVLKNVIKGLNEKEERVFFESIIIALSDIKNIKIIELIKTLPQIKPIYSFKTLYCLMKEFVADEPEMKKLEEYETFDIDVFELVNLLF